MEGTTADGDAHVTTDDLLNRIDELRSTVDRELDALRTQVQDLPNGNKLGDVADTLDVGDEYEVVIEDDGTGTNHGDPMARIDGIVTFLTAGPDVDVQPGDTVDVVVSSIDESHAKAVIRQDGDGDD